MTATHNPNHLCLLQQRKTILSRKSLVKLIVLGKDIDDRKSVWKAITMFETYRINSLRFSEA